MKPTTYFSVSHAGGQGKTTLAQVLHLALKRRGKGYRLVAADHIDESGRSKLGKLYPNRVEEYGTGAQLTAARRENNLNAPLRYWDRLGHVIIEGGCIVDVGANVIGHLLAWSNDRHLRSLSERRSTSKVDFLCVCKAERHAIDNTESLIRQIVTDRSFPVGRIFVVQNEIGGSFTNFPLQERLAKVDTGGSALTYLTLPSCYSEIWPAMERNGMPIEEALSRDEDELCKLLDCDLWTASGGLGELREWYDNVLKNLDEAGLFETGDTSNVKPISLERKLA